MKNFLLKKNYLNLLFIVIPSFSAFFSLYQLNLHYDGHHHGVAYSIAQDFLNGEVPFIDYWLVKGVLIDYIQAIFFYIFGISWKSYVLHASLFNALLTISTFFVLKNFVNVVFPDPILPVTPIFIILN